MVRNFCILNSPDGPTSVFYAGKLGGKGLLSIGIAILAAIILAAAVLFYKKRK